MTEFFKSYASRSSLGCARSIAIAVALTVTLGAASKANAIFISFGGEVQASCTTTVPNSLNESGSVKINSIFQFDSSTNVLDYVIKIPAFTGTVQSAALYNINDPNVDESNCSVSGATTIEVLDDSLSGSITLTSKEVIDLGNGEFLIIIIATDGTITYTWWIIIIKGFATIPTVSQWGLVAMTGLVLVAGTIVVQRRRRRIAA